MLRPTSALALLLALGLSASACDSDAPPAPTPDPPAEITDSFSGRLTINGAATHQFTIVRPGNAIATLGQLAPDAAAVISLGLGTWNGVSCQILIAKDDATSANTVIGQATTSGTFCVRVSDVGRLTAPTDYAITIVHF